jgi:amidase
LLGSRAPREATVAQLLRKAGAILLGKTNLSEWGNFRSSPQSSNNGWSSRGSQTYGIYYPGTEADGSSSGSAVSTILGLSTVGIGIEVRLHLHLPLPFYSCGY